MSTPSEKTEVVTKIVLVACVAKKANQAARAADLYQSQWFKFARAYAESTGCPWYILSAKHGFLYPSQILAPYEKQISGMSLGQQIMWAVNVYNRIKQTPSVYQGERDSGFRATGKHGHRSADGVDESTGQTMSTATVLTVPAETQWYDDALRAALAFAPYEETFVDEMARWRKLKQTTGDNSWWGILSALCNVWPGAYPEYSRDETKAVIHSDTLPDGSGIRWAVVECDMMPFFEAQRPSGETVHFRHCWLAKEAERVLGWPATKFPEYTPDEDGGKPWLFAFIDGHPINSPATLQMNTRPAIQAGLFEEAAL